MLEKSGKFRKELENVLTVCGIGSSVSVDSVWFTVEQLGIQPLCFEEEKPGCVQKEDLRSKT